MSSSARDPHSSATLRLYREGDEAAINAGFNEVFGLQRSLAEWHWKYPAEPEGRWIELAVDPAGAVLAHYAAVPVRYQVDGVTLRAGHVADSYCRRRFGLARQGLFPRTVERFFADCGAPDRLGALFGFPGARHLQLGVARMGYGPPLPVDYWTRPPGPPLPARGFHRVRPGFEPAAVDRLWRRAVARYPVAAVRDAAWLRRRYTGRPGVSYLHLAASSWTGRTQAWGVVRIEAGLLRWVELIWDGRSPGALAALEGAVVQAGVEAGAERLETWLHGDPEAARVLAGRGWRREVQPDGLHLSMKSFDPRFDTADLTRRMYLTMGDSDLV